MFHMFQVHQNTSRELSIVLELHARNQVSKLTLVVELRVLLSPCCPQSLDPIVIGSVALRKGPQRFCPHRSDRCCALMPTCWNSPLWQRSERCNNVLSSFWPPWPMARSRGGRLHWCHVDILFTSAIRKAKEALTFTTCSSLCRIAMVNLCCAPFCTNRAMKETKEWGIQFYRIPQDLKKKRLWLIAINRKGFKPGSGTYLCSAHFAGG